MDIQVTQRLISRILKAKALGEDLQDRVPGFQAVIDESGEILRGNFELAKALHVGHEDLLGVHIQDLLGAREWEVFSKRLKDMRTRNADHSQFELARAGGLKETSILLWDVRPFRHKGDSLVLVAARDVTELKKTTRELETLRKEAEVTQALQSLLLPRLDQVDADGFRLRSYYRAAAVSGGDWWCYIRRPDGSLMVIICDVMGHGIGAAMVTAAIAGTYLAIQTLGNQCTAHPNHADPRQLLEVLNQNIFEICRDHYWMAVSLIELDPTSSKLRAWNAGGTPILMCDSSGKINCMTIPGSPLGQDKSEIGHIEAECPSGSRILLFSDGAAEGKEGQGITKGMKRFASLLTDNRDETIDIVHQKLKAMIEKRWEGSTPVDDVTLVLLENRYRSGGS